MGLIEFKDVSFGYSKDKILQDINFNIGEGEVIGVVGDIGSGKTTLLKLINGLLKPSSGEVYINLLSTLDYTVADLSRYAGFMFQNPQEQLFQRRVYDEIVFSLKYKKSPDYYIKSRLKEVSDMLEIEDILFSRITEIPYYKKKLVALASVMVEDRDLIILDDPVQGLDRRARLLIDKAIACLRRENKTVLVSSNNFNFLSNNVDKVIVLDKGRMVGFDRISNILSKEGIPLADLDRPLINRLCRNLFDIDDIFKEKDFIKKVKEQYYE